MHFGASRHHIPLHLLLRTLHLTLLICTSTSSNLDLCVPQAALPSSHAMVLGTTTSIVRCHDLYNWELRSNYDVAFTWCGGLRNPRMTIQFMRRLKRLGKTPHIMRLGLYRNGECRVEGHGHCWTCGAASVLGRVGALGIYNLSAWSCCSDAKRLLARCHTSAKHTCTPASKCASLPPYASLHLEVFLL